MANIAKLLGQKELTTVLQTIYTAPASTKAILFMLRATNKSASAQRITLYAGPNQNLENALAFALPIPPGGSVELGRGLVLEAADTIQALADANSFIGVTATGVEVS